MLRLFNAFLLAVITLSVTAQDKSISCDGPYVFYKNNLVYSKSIIDGKVCIDSFPAKEKTKHILQVQVAAHPEWAFPVQLQETIAPHPAVHAATAKMFFLSDIEGEFEAFRSLLIGNKIMDEKYNWIFGNNRLVIAGDLFDRGNEVAQYIWLLYKLEYDARSHGGDVHIVLGNHDIMNLKGDFRYVQPAYMNNAALLNESYAALYGNSTELGRWLRSKNIVEKIGDLLVLHGGVSPEAISKQFSLERINTSCRPFYDTPTKQIPDSVKAFLGNTGLFWYRDYFSKDVDCTGAIDSTCSFYGVRQIVVGHTITKENIALYRQATIVGLDVNQHKGQHAAALWERKQWQVTDNKGNHTAMPAVTAF